MRERLEVFTPVIHQSYHTSIELLKPVGAYGAAILLDRSGRPRPPGTLDIRSGTTIRTRLAQSRLGECDTS
jgi:hypothetical protein